MEEIDISPCTEEPCVLHKGTNATVQVKFKTSKGLISAWLKRLGEASILEFALDALIFTTFTNQEIRNSHAKPANVCSHSHWPIVGWHLPLLHPLAVLLRAHRWIFRMLLRK